MFMFCSVIFSSFRELTTFPRAQTVQFASRILGRRTLSTRWNGDPAVELAWTSLWVVWPGHEGPHSSCHRVRVSHSFWWVQGHTPLSSRKGAPDTHGNIVSQSVYPQVTEKAQGSGAGSSWHGPGAHSAICRNVHTAPVPSLLLDKRCSAWLSILVNVSAVDGHAASRG